MEPEVIRRNIKNGKPYAAPIRVERGTGVEEAMTVAIHGPSVLRGTYTGPSPHVWIETESEISLEV